MSKVHVIGVGMTNFTKPGDPDAPDYHISAGQAMKQHIIGIGGACVMTMYGIWDQDAHAQHASKARRTC